MKYSLRSLMIVVTLVCVLLGGVMGRAEYMRRWADFHHREAEAFEAKLKESDDLHKYNQLLDAIIYHQKMEDRYRVAIHRLMTTVDDSDLDKPTP